MKQSKILNLRGSQIEAFGKMALMLLRSVHSLNYDSMWIYDAHLVFFGHRISLK